jgi:hypothetical protein
MHLSSHILGEFILGNENSQWQFLTASKHSRNQGGLYLQLPPLCTAFIPLVEKSRNQLIQWLVVVIRCKFLPLLLFKLPLPTEVPVMFHAKCKQYIWDLTGGTTTTGSSLGHVLGMILVIGWCSLNLLRMATGRSLTHPRFVYCFNS